MLDTFPDPWLANGPDRAPQQTWYGVSRALPHAATLGRLARSHPHSRRTVAGVGTFLGPITRADHPTTWSHHGLQDHGDDGHRHWWCLSESAGGVGVGARLWGNTRIAQVVAGFTNPRSRTALVRVGTAPT